MSIKPLIPATPTEPKKQGAGSDAPKVFHEALAVIDESDWIWNLTFAAFHAEARSVVRITSSTPVRHTWNRLRTAPCIVIHWEAKGRTGGAIIEEIIDVDPNYDVANKIIVLTSNPIHEDVVYFSELGVRRIVRVRNRDKELEANQIEMRNHIVDATEIDKRPTLDSLWRKILAAVDRLPVEPEEAVLQRFEENILKMRGINKPAARDLDALGSIAFKRKDLPKAFELWNAALENNPNYFRAYQNMIQAHRQRDQHNDAYQLMQKMQLLNRSNISRLVAMGETQLALHDDRKAEHYFKSALERDGWSSGALNGMANLKFRQGDLDGARSMLERSRLSYRFSALLNLQGIEMVKLGKYSEALEHYSKAQYVLPQQEKGPQLFYNIGLCYSRWNKMEMAQEFLKLALIKEPNYKKAQRLLDLVQQRTAPEGKDENTGSGLQHAS